MTNRKAATNDRPLFLWTKTSRRRSCPLSIRPTLRSALAMHRAAIVPAAPSPALALAELDARAHDYAAAAHAPNTLRAYAADLRAFAAWGRAFQLVTLPADPRTVARYLAALADAGRKCSTIGRALTAINVAHTRAGFPGPREAPQVRDAWRGVRRVLSVAPRQKAPILVEDLRALATALPSTLHGTRDRAILVLGWAMGARRSEVVALEVADLRLTADGFEITIRRSKTDQEGAGHVIGVPFGSTPATCPVRTVLAWKSAANVEAGPLFRSLKNGRPTSRALDGRDLARVVQAAAVRAGLAADLAGHSLRAGLITQAARTGKNERDIMQHTGHRSAATLRRYIRAAGLFTSSNPAQGIGL
jgi:site-specific recombinase XerD